MLVAIALAMLEFTKISPLWGSHLSHNTLKPRLEPLDRIVLVHLVTLSDGLSSSPPPSHSCTGSRHAAVEVHSIDTNCRVILDAQIDMLRDTEPEVASIREVLLAEFVFLDLQATFEDFFSFGASDRDMDCDLLVTSDAEGADGVAGFACNDTSVCSWPIEGRGSYCKREFDHSAAQALWQHE